MPLRSTLNGAQYHVLTLRILATPARIGIRRGREFLRIQEPRRKNLWIGSVRLVAHGAVSLDHDGRTKPTAAPAVS